MKMYGRSRISIELDEITNGFLVQSYEKTENVRIYSSTLDEAIQTIKALYKNRRKKGKSK